MSFLLDCRHTIVARIARLVATPAVVLGFAVGCSWVFPEEEPPLVVPTASVTAVRYAPGTRPRQVTQEIQVLKPGIVWEVQAPALLETVRGRLRKANKLPIESENP